MKKIVLIDGNNFMFRSYYATAYSGAILRNSKGMPTNALYGFVSMIDKIIKEEKPEYMAVAFDIGTNFRKKEIESYKAGRQETPTELKQQFPVIKDILKCMGIKYFELEPYEADDIIGTFSKMCDDDPNYKALIVSSDKDLLQLISDETEVKLLKSKDYIKYNKNNFKDDWGFTPIHIIDYKAIAGDTSDNIPGVKGIGDKGAINLLSKYEDLDDIYNHIDEIKGATHDKLVASKEDAYLSKRLATIVRDVPLDVKLDDITYTGPDLVSLNKIYEELEFYSFIKKNTEGSVAKENNIKYKYVEDINDLVLDDKVSLYIEGSKENYHDASIIGMAISTKDNNYYISNSIINDVISNFYGVEHRLEFVDEVNNVRFYNDTEATNVKCTQIALSSFDKPTIIILGGLERGQNFDDLISFCKNVKAIIGIGECRERVREFSEKNNIPVYIHEHLKDGFKDIVKIMEKGDIVLLSPASASWDQYKECEERGAEFKDLVKGIKNGSNKK